MSLSNTFKIFASVTGSVTGRTYKIDINKISAIFDENHINCKDGAHSFMRYIDTDNTVATLPLKEQPAEIVKAIEAQQKKLLGASYAVKAFVPVASAYRGEMRGYIALDDIHSLSTPSEDALKKYPSAASTINYNTYGKQEKRINSIESVDELEQKIYAIQEERAKYIRRQMAAAIF
ncbi:MAG: hypothetical protein VYC19_08530 [Pseudomonadota bacterium]|nr:hypothetical protein [Pseudomonadota bacterium]MEC7702790.1 hypothetical protein [Pseudomonadota bacterium]MEE3323661.1 hypothetical protein [Pseudomonadota bacterium]